MDAVEMAKKLAFRVHSNQIFLGVQLSCLSQCEALGVRMTITDTRHATNVTDRAWVGGSCQGTVDI